MQTNSRAMILGVAMIAALCASPVRALTLEYQAKIKTEVNAAMQNYVDAFNRSDGNSIGNSSFTNPSFAIGPSGLSTRTPEQMAQQYTNTTKRLAETGWVKSVGGRYSICVINATAALFNGRFDRVRKDGSVMTETATTYLFNKGKDGWRIAALWGHDINKVVTCNE